MKKIRVAPGVVAAIPLEQRRQPARIHMDDPCAGRLVARKFSQLLTELDPGRTRPVVFACIGTDRSTGDSLGPLVGTFLCRQGLPSSSVIGTLDTPLHAANLVDTLVQHGLLGRRPAANSPVVIAVDACLGAAENVGTITVGAGAIKPGAGVRKNLPPVGDIYITGTVNTGGFMEFFVLQNTRLSLVMRMASIIADGLALAFK